MRDADKSAMAAGRIFEQAVRLDGIEGVEVFCALHGNTKCICVEVKENKTIVYQNRVFVTNTDSMWQMSRELYLMAEKKIDGEKI